MAETPYRLEHQTFPHADGTHRSLLRFRDEQGQSVARAEQDNDGTWLMTFTVNAPDEATATAMLVAALRAQAGEVTYSEADVREAWALGYDSCLDPNKAPREQDWHAALAAIRERQPLRSQRTRAGGTE